jgi:hypothetical protein
MPPVNPGQLPQKTVADILSYHIHIISFLGFGIRVASMQLNPASIDPYDVITACFSEAGRQATYRVNTPSQ